MGHLRMMGCWILASACGVAATDGSESGSTETETGSGIPTVTETEVPSFAFSGVVTDEDGGPVSARVNMCNLLCYTVFSDETDGTFAFPAPLPKDAYWFYVVPLDLYDPLSTTSVPLDFSNFEGDADSREVVLPPVHAWIDLPAVAAPLALAPGLTVTAGIDNLDRMDTSVTKAAAAPVEFEDLPDVVLPDGEFVAAWYVQPLEAKPKTGQTIAFEIEDTWGGDDGQVYRVYTGQYEWTLRGELTMTDGKLVGSDLGELTSILVVRIPQA